MMVRLYYSSVSGNSQKVHLALEEVGADYEIVHVDLSKGDQRRPEYLELNPNGRVPTLIDGDFVLWESNAILGYLADKYPAVELMPTDRLKRARVQQFLFWQSTVLGPAVQALLGESRLKAPEERDPQAVERALQDAGSVMGLLGSLLGGRPHAVGERTTIADLAMGPYVRFASRCGIQPPAGAEPWFRALSARASWKKVYSGVEGGNGSR